MLINRPHDSFHNEILLLSLFGLFGVWFFLLNFGGKLQGQKVDEGDRELSGIRMHDVESKKNKSRRN